jgi:hypothetical protein
MIKNGDSILQSLNNGGQKMSEKKLKYLFNPEQKEPKQLKAEFVVRTEIFEQLFKEIKEDKMSNPPQHYMLLGQRGMGKTTLLLRLKYAVQEDENLNKWLIPIIFNEEQYAMQDLASFFEQIANLLEENHPEYSGLLENMRKLEFEKDYDQKAFEILSKELKAKEKKLIVFHDNFGQFLEKIGKTSAHRLRKILMTSADIRLIGASATLLEHTANYDKPFFEFFYQIRLNGMNKEETLTLFEKLAESEGETEQLKKTLEDGAGRIDVIRKLSGGVIRTMVMLFDVFMDNPEQDSFKDLEAILDRVTPLYKHRMDDLKPQQQVIVDAVARAWDAVTVKDIAKLIRAERHGLKTNQISAQLKQLVDNGIIEIEPDTTGRTHLYRLQERFFNIWYLMRYSTRKDKQRVVWFVRFLESWCNQNDLKALFERFENNLASGTYSPETVYNRALAYSQLKSSYAQLGKEKSQILERAITFLEKNNFGNLELNYLKKQKHEIFLEFLVEQLQLNWQTMRNNNNPERLTFSYESFHNLKQHEELDPLLKLNILIIFFSITFLLIGSVQKSIDGIKIALADMDFTTNTYISEFFILLIAFKQNHSLQNLFNEYPILKEHYKPIYFLNLKYLQDSFPNEYLKAGSEMKESISELEDTVKQLREKLKL